MSMSPTRAMPDDAGLAFLAALQLADSSLPIGRMVHSQGLEAWLVGNLDAGPAQIGQVVETMILEVAAPLDGVILVHAHRAADAPTLRALDAFATACKVTQASRDASSSCGRRLARIATRLAPIEPALSTFFDDIATGSTPGHLAVVEGALTRTLGLAEREAVLLEMRGAKVPCRLQAWRSAQHRRRQNWHNQAS